MILKNENMIIDDDKNDDKNDGKNIQQLTFRKIGGFNLLDDRPFITDDNESLLIISKKKIRKYLINNGNFINEYNFGLDSLIIAIQRYNLNECLIVFDNGHIIQWNYQDNYRISEQSIDIDDYPRQKLIYYKRIDNVCYIGMKRRKKVNECRYQFYYYYQNNNKNRFIFDQIFNSNCNNNLTKITSKIISFHLNGKLCAIINQNQLHLYQLPIDEKNSLKKIFGKNDTNTKKFFTSLSFHPFEMILATGDSNGQIHIWNDLFGKNPAKSVLHWHSQSVLDLAFSPTGTSIYSVGNEMVLVKWNLIGQNYGEKIFVPRLGDKIRYVTVDQKNKFLITSHQDHTIRIIDSQMNGIRTVIEGLTFADNLDAGLHFNPRLNTIIMNGRIGHIQLYSPLNQRQLFQFDITEQNIINVPNIRKDKKNFKNVDEDHFIPIRITKIAINDNGDWMATIEYRNDSETSPEIRLKFWLLRKENNGFILNTTIHLPHDDFINHMEFSSLNNDEQHLVTTSLDKTFKIWDINYDLNNKRKWWNCSRNGSINNYLIPRMAKFSPDSSLLTVLFDKNMITMWELNDNDNNQKSIRYIPRMDIFNLSDQNDQQDDNEIIFIGFGENNLQHYLIEGRKYHLIVRNIINKFKIIFQYNIHDDYKKERKIIEPIKIYNLKNGNNLLSMISNDRIRFVSLKQQTIIAQINLMTMKNFSGTIVSSLFYSINNGNDDERIFFCITNNNELFQAIPITSNDNIVDDFSDSINVGTHNDFCTELFIKNISDEQNKNFLSTLMAVDNKDLLNMDSNNTTTTTTNGLIEKYFYQIPSHLLPPIQIIETTFLNDYYQQQMQQQSLSNEIIDEEEDLNNLNNLNDNNELQPNHTITSIETNINNNDDEEFNWINKYVNQLSFD